MTIDVSFLSRISPGYRCFPEVSNRAELDALVAIYGEGSTPLSETLRRQSIDLYQEMNMTTDSRRFSRTEEVLESVELPRHLDPRREPTRSSLVDDGWLVVHEKGTFHAFDDGRKTQPRYLCHTSQLLKRTPNQKLKALDASRYFRLVARSTIHASEADKSVFCVIPPGCVVGNSALSEALPNTRPNAVALIVMAVCNSRPFNFVTKLRMGTNLNQFLFESLPFPALTPPMEAFCAHAALRLICNHEAYFPLWNEQVGAEWREGHESLSFPVIYDDEKRTMVRAALDAVVARAYDLDRDHYAHLLDALEGVRGSVPHESLCLRAFDELARDGLATFCERHDPYGDVPLVMDRPWPAPMEM